MKFMYTILHSLTAIYETVKPKKKFKFCYFELIFGKEKYLVIIQCRSKPRLPVTCSLNFDLHCLQKELNVALNPFPNNKF